MEQSHITDILLDRLSQQFADAQDAEQRNQIGKMILSSKRVTRLLDHVDADRLHDKTQSVMENQQLMDKVHISPEAHDLFHQMNVANQAPTEKVHTRRQDEPENPLPMKVAPGPDEPES